MSRESRMTAGSLLLLLLPRRSSSWSSRPTFCPSRHVEEACRVPQQEAGEAPRLFLHVAQTGSKENGAAPRPLEVSVCSEKGIDRWSAT